MQRMNHFVEAWKITTQSVSDGIAGNVRMSSLTCRLNGKRIQYNASSSLSFSCGLAMSGMRTNTLLSDDSFAESEPFLRQAARNHTPLVITVSSRCLNALLRFASNDTFLFWADTPQELSDRILLAHRISEMLLMPGIVAFPELSAIESPELLLPSDEQLMSFVGVSDHRIDSPTPAQQMFFGKSRRRIPNWFSADTPVMTGAEKSLLGKAYEATSQTIFFADHIESAIIESSNEWEKITGRILSAYTIQGIEKRDAAILSFGNQLKKLNAKDKEPYGRISLHQLLPLPNQLTDLLSNIKYLGIVEQSANSNHLLSDKLCLLLTGLPVIVTTGLYSASLAPNQLSAYVEKWWSRKEKSQKLRMDVMTPISSSLLPKHDVRMKQLQREYPSVSEHSVNLLADTSIKSTFVSKHIPLSLRKHTDKGPAYSRLSEFFDHTVFFYDTASADWFSDPSQAIPVVPSSTASFGRGAENKNKIPVIQTEKCTGCGDCFVYCPHAALPSVALSMEACIKSGISIAQSRGEMISQIVPMQKAFVKLAYKEASKIESDRPIFLKEIIKPAGVELANQLALDGDKRTGFLHECDAISESIGELQISITDTFYRTPQAVAKDTGELFALSVDTNACIGCGICESVCEEEAIIMQDISTEILAQAQKQYAIWEQLSDTSSDTIARLIDNADYSSAAAIMLSRNFYMTMHGAGSHEDAVARTLLHLVSSVAEATVQPVVSNFLSQIDHARQQLSDSIKKALADAIPPSLFTEFSKMFSDVSSERVSIDEIIEKGKEIQPMTRLNKSLLERRSSLLKSLGALKQLVSEGNSGMGRARYAVILDASLSSLATYPNNPFSTPVTLMTASSPDMILGLVTGHTESVIDNMKLMRMAALEVDGSYNPAIHDEEIASLSYERLTPEERLQVPPVLVAIRYSSLAKLNMRSTLQMLHDGWPVKWIVLDDISPNQMQTSGEIVAKDSWIYSAIATQQAYILKSSLADTSHLINGLLTGFKQSGSAIFWLLESGAEKELLSDYSIRDLQRLAMHSRSYQHADYNPQREGRLVSSHISLSSNSSPDQDWQRVSLKYMEDNEEKEFQTVLTWADWCFANRTSSEEFSLFHPGIGSAVAVEEYLQQSEAERKGKVPVLYRLNARKELVRYVVPQYVIMQTESVMRNWRMLKEFSGDLTEYPEKLYALAQKEASAGYEMEKKKLIEEYESRIQQLEQEYLLSVREKLKNKLVELSIANRQ